MSRGGGGTYTLPAGNPVVTGTTITSTWANGTLTDIATALTDSLSRSGLGGMTAPLLGTDGTAAAPAVAFTSQPDTGLYLFGPDQLGFATSGLPRGRIESTGNWFIPAPTSGTTMFIRSITSNQATEWSDGTATMALRLDADPAGYFGTVSNHPLRIGVNAGTAVTIAAAGNVSIAAPGSGAALTVAGVTNVPVAQFNGASAGTAIVRIRDGQAFLQEWDFRVGNFAAQAWELFDVTRNARVLSATSAGNVEIRQPSSGQALTVTTTATGSGLLALGNTILGTDNTSQVRFNNQSSSSASAGSSGALPAQVVGYLNVNVNATQVKIPYYNV